ncbi:MAG: L,D-transpeptidase [Verrucomicrobiae bacterium]|nr:L,D-transpeptidase [Verrucomicrobiae bacterium]
MACRRIGVLPGRYILVVCIPEQRMFLYSQSNMFGNVKRPLVSVQKNRDFYCLVRVMVVSTSRFGVGQLKNSFKTPLGLHRIAKKIGGGYPVGAVFESRRHVGFTWTSHPNAAIVHRIMWLEGLEEGFNRGGDVDSFSRYIYIHGFSDETTLGKPMSRGCIHVSGDDILPLFDILPEGALVWITDKIN